MYALNLYVQGEAQGAQAAANPFDFVRLQEMQQGFSGTASLHHTHVYTDITNFGSGVLSVLQANGYTPGSPFELKVNGGLLEGADGIYVDSGIVSFVGHVHRAADIVDFAAALLPAMEQDLIDSASISWQLFNSGVQASVNLDPAGGLTVDANGLSANWGSGVSQIPRGNHTHPQLHNALTVAASTSLKLTLNNQQLSVEAWLDPLGGLVIGASGIRCNFGPGPYQVMPGNAPTGGSFELNVFSTASLILGYDPTTDSLSGIVRLDQSPPVNGGLLQQTSNGLSVVLGEDADTAAAGNHTHPIANSGTAGFMSPAQVIQLNSLTGLNGYLKISGGIMAGAIFMNTDSIYFGSGYGVRDGNGNLVTGFQQAAPALLVDDVDGSIAALLAAIPSCLGTDSGVALLVADLNNNILPKIRNAVSSMAATQNALISALKTFGCIH